MPACICLWLYGADGHATGSRSYALAASLVLSHAQTPIGRNVAIFKALKEIEGTAVHSVIFLLYLTV